MSEVLVLLPDNTPPFTMEFEGDINDIRAFLLLGPSTGGIASLRTQAASVTVERIRTPINGPDGPLVMLVDEDGMHKQLTLNPRAMAFYPGCIYGPAILTYEKDVIVDGEPDVAWIGIPSTFNLGVVAEDAFQRLEEKFGEHPFIASVEAEAYV